MCDDLRIKPGMDARDLAVPMDCIDVAVAGMDCSNMEWMDCSDVATGSIATNALVSFVLKYRWIWDGQVTKFFTGKWWTRIPAEVSSN